METPKNSILSKMIGISITPLFKFDVANETESDLEFHSENIETGSSIFSLLSRILM